MFATGTKVRVRTIDELISEGKRIEGRGYIKYWENTVCEVIAVRNMISENAYMLKAPNDETVIRQVVGTEDYALNDVWWKEYELELYDPFRKKVVDESVFSKLIDLECC